ESCGFWVRTTAWTCTVPRFAESTGLTFLRRSWSRSRVAQMCACCRRRKHVANPNKRRGTRWETEFARFLNRELELVTPDGDEFLDPTSPLNVRRQAQQGIHDVGDLWVIPFVVECKNTARHELPAYVRQAEQEARNAGLSYGV